jgi:transposase-like protein
MMKIYPQSVKDEAVRRRKNGESLGQIAKALNIRAPSVICNWLKRNGGPPAWSEVKACVLDAFEQAAKVPQLEAELQRLRNVNLALKNEVACLSQTANGVRDEERRYSLARQQGEICGVQG